MKRFVTLLCTSWFAYGASMAGQEDPMLRFLAERTPENLGEVELVAGKKISPSFGISSRSLSDPVPAPARRMTLRSRSKAVALAEISLPGKGDAFIVLLIPDRKRGYLPVVIPADDANFQRGDVYFFNHTQKPVFGFVGTAKFILKPGEGKPLRPAGAKEDTYYDVAFGFRDTDGDRVMRTLRWPVLTRSRSYVFFYHNPVRNRIDFRAVDEFQAPAEASASP